MDFAIRMIRPRFLSDTDRRELLACVKRQREDHGVARRAIADGRGRVNIHGALNLENFDTPLIAPATVDGTSAVQLLAKIEARNPEKRIIHVIWDNAAYHKGPDVRAFLARKSCRIQLIQLPPYCPHLNPIERLWAVMHQHVTHN